MLRNKIDLVAGGDPRTELLSTKEGINRSFAMSAQSGLGVDSLVGALSDFASSYFGATELAIVTRARHRQAFEETIAALDRALGHRASGAEELIAEELRSAATTLGRLTGRVDVEDVLDVIFRDFCIGK
jgi:tRNA modification GTPase